jgi:AraC-like DNA-binding protein
MRVFVRTETRSVLWPAAEPVELSPIELRPSGPLAAYVECIRFGRGVFEREVVERVLPDGAVHMFFELGETCSATVAGATTAPTLVRLSGVLEHVGVQLRAGGIAALLGVPAAELNGHQIPLEALWGAQARALLERLVRAPAGQRIALVRAALIERLGRRHERPDPRVAAAVRSLLAARGNVSVRNLAESLELGERRLEQLFQREVGLSAKALGRVTRLRYTVDHVLEHRGAGWSEVAQACGFYDQAHMIREFRALAGETPGALAQFGFFQYAAAVSP